MRFLHVLTVLLVVAIWGANFVAIKVATETIPPIFLAGIRMFFTGVPLIFFIKRPSVSWLWIAAYGFSIFSLNFGFLFAGMNLGMSAGLTSLIFQTQIFFTVGLSMIFFKERVKAIQILYAILAFSGVIIIAVHRGGTTTPAGLVFVLLACLSWAFGNIASKKIGKVNLLGLVVWAGLLASIPLLLFSAIVESPEILQLRWTDLRGWTLFSIAFLIYPTTILGFSLWSWLLNLYSTPILLPFTLLVPVFGMFSAFILLKESLDLTQVLGAALVFFGVSLNVLWSLRRRRNKA